MLNINVHVYQGGELVEICLFAKYEDLPYFKMLQTKKMAK